MEDLRQHFNAQIKQLLKDYHNGKTTQNDLINCALKLHEEYHYKHYGHLGFFNREKLRKKMRQYCEQIEVTPAKTREERIAEYRQYIHDKRG